MKLTEQQILLLKDCLIYGVPTKTTREILVLHGLTNSQANRIIKRGRKYLNKYVQKNREYSKMYLILRSLMGASIKAKEKIYES
jgi:hypothetical protein